MVEVYSIFPQSHRSGVTAVGDHVLMVDSSGGYVPLGILFLKVTAFVGTSFSLAADFVLS